MTLKTTEKATISQHEEVLIRAWLHYIGESDLELITACRKQRIKTTGLGSRIQSQTRCTRYPQFTSTPKMSNTPALCPGHLSQSLPYNPNLGYP